MKQAEARSLLERLIGRIAPEVDLAEADPDASIQEELDLDSMDFLNILTSLREETGIDVPERDYASVGTINDFVAYVARASEREAIA